MIFTNVPAIDLATCWCHPYSGSLCVCNHTAGRQHSHIHPHACNMEKCECMVYDKKRSPYDPEDHMGIEPHYAGDPVVADLLAGDDLDSAIAHHQVC